ncbi:MAG: LutC/YkgG family protein [Gammaproteobacteria bacterium]
MSQRDAILDRLRKAPVHPVAVPDAPRPALGADPRAQFTRRAEALHTVVEGITDRAALPGAVARILTNNTGPLVVAPALRDLDWSDVDPCLSAPIHYGSTDGSHRVAVSEADAAIAETGTLVLRSGPGNPTRLNFLPDLHIVLLSAEAILGHLEDFWSSIAGQDPGRVVNFITGPSRTADIEQTIQLGAHGPRALHVLITESP